MKGKYGVSMNGKVEHSNLQKRINCDCSHCKYAYSKNDYRYCSIRKLYEPKFYKCRYFKFCKNYKLSKLDEFRKGNNDKNK